MNYDCKFSLTTNAMSKVVAVLVLFIIAGTTHATGRFFNTKIVNCDTPWGLSINRAIAIADDGDRIIVTGICTENVIVDKGVTLEGRGTASIIPADTTMPTVLVTARNVTVDGFILESPTTGSQVHITDQSFATISNNQIGNAGVNVVITGGSLAELVGNRIYGSSAESVSILENATARVGFKGSLANPDIIGNVIENNFNGVVVARAHANIVGNQIINNERNGVVVARSGTARVAANEIAGNNVGVANVTNGATDLSLSNPDSPLGVPNFGINRALSIFCNSGFIGDVIGPDFLPGMQILGTCVNETTL